MLRGLTLGAMPYLILTASLAHAAQPADPCGTWKLKCVSPDGKARECVVTVCKEGETLKGTYAADGAKKAVKAVSFEEGILSVQVDGEFAGQCYGLTYKGKPSGDTLCGSVRWSYGWASGSFSFEGERIAQAVAAVP